MKITLIAAMDDNLGIGRDGKLPWHNKYDLQHFKYYTEGKVCVMGRKTWDSLPVKPLPFRTNCVVSKDIYADKHDNSDRVFSSISDCVNHWKNITNELIIIGGASIYEQFMPHATHMVLTHINGNYNCDTFFLKLFSSRFNFIFWSISVSK